MPKNFGSYLLMHNDQCARIVRRGGVPNALAIPTWAGPIKEPFGIGIGHVDTAVTHGMTKIIVPIGAMKTIVGIEVLHPFHIGQVVIAVAW